MDTASNQQQNDRIMVEVMMIVLAIVCAIFAFAVFNVAFEDKDAMEAVLATVCVIMACIFYYIGVACL